MMEQDMMENLANTVKNFGTPSQAWIEWLESLHSASDGLAFKTNVINEEEN
jgi:hypothetical protein